MGGNLLALFVLHKNHISFYINRRENHTNRFEKVSQIVLYVLRRFFESRLRGSF